MRRAKHTLRAVFVSAAGLLLGSSVAVADAIVITQAMLASTIAEIFIDEAAIRVDLEIGVADLAAFRNLLPEEINRRLGVESEPLAERLPRFFGEDLVFRTADGRALPGWVRQIEGRQRVRRDDITGEPLPVSEDEDEGVLFVSMEYPFADRPSNLTMSPPGMSGDVAAASIGFVVYHLGVPVTDFRYFGSVETLDLDWQDPWYSRFRNRNLRRQYDAPLNAFLYIEPYEVRVEIIARPIDLQQWVDLGLEGRRTIPVEMQGEMKLKIAEFLAGHTAVTIDGVAQVPTLDRIHFLRRTLRNSTVIDPPEELDAFSATLGVIYIFATDGLPDEATLTWDLFGPKIQRVPAAATDEAGPLPYILQPDDPVLIWKNFLQNPTLPTLTEIEAPPPPYTRVLRLVGWLAAIVVLWIGARQLLARRRGAALSRGAWIAAGTLLLIASTSLIIAQRSAVDEERASSVLAGLLHNIYRAFDFRDESTIYDVLDRSVTGDLLTQTYLETRRGLELASQGGARAKVKEIELLSVEPQSLRGEVGFMARCTWSVAGSVGHWGHVHRRTNQYEADLTIKPIDGVWKITELELLQEERL